MRGRAAKNRVHSHRQYALECFYWRLGSRATAPASASTSPLELKAEKLTRMVPTSSVPAERCASGAQWSPERTGNPLFSQCLPHVFTVHAVHLKGEHPRLAEEAGRRKDAYARQS